MVSIITEEIINSSIPEINYIKATIMKALKINSVIKVAYLSIFSNLIFFFCFNISFAFFYDKLLTLSKQTIKIVI